MSKSVVLAVAALALLLTLMLWARGGLGGRRDGESPNSTSLQPRDEELSPRLVAARKLDEFDLRYAQPERARRETAGALVRVRGVIRVDRGVVSGAHVYAVHDDGEFDLLAETDSDEAGGYTIEFPQAGSAVVHIGALADGLQRSTKQIGVHPGSVIELDFLLVGGETIEGLVLDDEGTPVGGIEVFATSIPYITTAGRTGKYFAFNEFRFARSDSSYYEAYAVTDGRGWFRAKGLGPGTYILRSHDPRWFIRQNYGRVTPGTPDLTFTATRSHTLNVGAVNADTGAPIPEFRCIATVRMGGSDAYVSQLIGEDGSLTFTWPSLRGGAEFEDGFDMQLLIRSPKMEELARTVRYERGELERIGFFRAWPRQGTSAQVI